MNDEQTIYIPGITATLGEAQIAASEAGREAAKWRHRTRKAEAQVSRLQQIIRTGVESTPSCYSVTISKEILSCATGEDKEAAIEAALDMIRVELVRLTNAREPWGERKYREQRGWL
jgi:hypothetical protein